MSLDLSNNDKAVLKRLLDNGRISDREISKKLNISSQAVGKIRKKLESSGIIEGYSINLNFEKIGINTFALFHTNLTPKFLKAVESKGLAELYSRIPQVIVSAKLVGSDYNFFGIQGFRNQIEMEDYVNKLQMDGENLLNIVKVDTFSLKSLIKDFNKKDLFKEILEDKTPVSAIELLKKSKK